MKKSFSNNSVNLAEILKEAIMYFCLFDKSHFSNIYTLLHVTIEFIEINWMCEHRKKVTSSSASISMNLCNELSETQFCLSMVNHFPFFSDSFYFFSICSEHPSQVEQLHIPIICRISFWNSIFIFYYPI